MANVPQQPGATTTHERHAPAVREDWLADLRDWIRLCQHGLEPREAWQRVQQSQAPLS